MTTNSLTKARAILNDIVRDGYLEDRYEYMEDDLAQAYDLNRIEAEVLRALIVLEMNS